MKIITLFCTAALYSTTALATDLAQGNVPQTLTLEKAQKIALQNHPHVLSAELNTRSAEENVKVVRSAYLPQVDGTAVSAFASGDTRIAAPYNALNNPSVIDRTSGGISVSQLITDFGKTSDLVAASKYELTAQKARTEDTKENILLQVTSAYYNVLRAQSLLKVAESTLKTRSALLEQVSSLREEKMRSDLDLSIAKQGVADANLLLLKAKKGVDDAQATLSEALGMSSTNTFMLSDNMQIPLPPAQVESLMNGAMDKNPELAALKAEMESQKKAADAAREANYPTVNALGYAGGSPITENSQPIKSNYAAAGVTITIPFYTGGRISAQERGSEDKAFAAEQDYTARKNELMRDIRIAFDNAQTAYKNIDVTKQLAKSAHESLELTQARYDLGKSSIVDLSEAQLFETQAEITGTNAAYEYMIQLAILNFRTGNNL
jgi:outer membrane protein